LILIKDSMGLLWFETQRLAPVVGNESAGEDWCKVSNNHRQERFLQPQFWVCAVE
jgi:hypothetical protein